MRAIEPDVEGFVERGGVKIGYEVFNAGATTGPPVVFTPTDPIVHSGAWKAQVPYLARRHMVVTIDPPGNGRSDRPGTVEAYSDAEFVAATIAVLDATNVDSAVLVGLCSSAWRALLTAARHPGRALGVVGIATFAPWLTPPLPARVAQSWDDELPTDDGWAKDNKHYWRRDWRGFAEFFFDQLLPEPHSSKQWEDCVGWAMEIGPDQMILQHGAGWASASRAETEALLRQVRCPVLTIHGDDDRCQPPARGARVAELTGGRHVTLAGAGHLPQARHPVVVNRLLRDFLGAVRPAPPEPARWAHRLRRPPRVLYLCSPIGLGHARRDLAIATELRKLRPDAQIDWLTQPPVTDVLARSGERVHPASTALANESRHFETEAGEHDLHAFTAVRRMDEILVANFMVFHDLVEREQYDLWVGDEAWDVDYFLHENPELKRAPYAWLTDFVGWLPMPDGGDREAWLAADYNAEMVEQIDRFPRLRDRAIFVGDPDDIVPDRLGERLPGIREWTEQHFDFAGYVTGFDPAGLGSRDELRASLGYRPGERVCVVTVGGSGVGEPLLRKVVAAYPAARQLVPGLRMIVVTGPRIDPAGLLRAAGVAGHPGLEVRGYVPELYRHLAGCDLAVVQGGLTTTMELVAAGRPFLYFPLRHHFEQQFHVAHRLRRYGAGRRMDYPTATPDVIAAAIAAEIDARPQYRPVETDGAARAAALLADLF
ncbi:MAG TPA: alpha/beta fold hydrolase [Mycobacteriales bacterium]|nr:alpha/beta fold hydrolase [Mycobacteriales bacterium]